MKRIIFTCIICLFGIASTQAQQGSKKSSRKNASDKSASTQQLLRDKHWQLSEYRPTTTKKERKELTKNVKQQQTRSYRADKSPYYRKAEAREIKAQRVRQQRMKDERTLLKEKKIKRAKKDSDKRYSERQRTTAQKVNKNKKNFGTRASRKRFNNQSDMFAPKPKINN